MTSHAALRADADGQGRRSLRPSCPKCHDIMIAATASEHVSRCHVRHLWVCESCGHAFATSVKLPAQEARAARPALC